MYSPSTAMSFVGSLGGTGIGSEGDVAVAVVLGGPGGGEEGGRVPSKTDEPPLDDESAMELSAMETAPDGLSNGNGSALSSDGTSESKVIPDPVVSPVCPEKRELLFSFPFLAGLVRPGAAFGGSPFAALKASALEYASAVVAVINVEPEPEVVPVALDFVPVDFRVLRFLPETAPDG